MLSFAPAACCARRLLESDVWATRGERTKKMATFVCAYTASAGSEFGLLEPVRAACVDAYKSFPTSAVWATESFRPAELKQILPASRLGRKAVLQLQQISRINFHRWKPDRLWSPESSTIPICWHYNFDPRRFQEAHTIHKLSISPPTAPESRSCPNPHPVFSLPVCSSSL